MSHQQQEQQQHAAASHLPQMHSTPSHQLPPQVLSSQQQFARLKVEDALSYLDRVKQQFCSNPQVYNHFLDIMKEFKSQSIDTPGVITRVSHLFKGHPDLIVGFNTFLPPGYKIELNAATDTISVYQPSMKGTMSMGISLSSFENLHQRGGKSPRAPLPDAVSEAPASGATTESTGGQPVEFNHAIFYVNKIKNCYQSKPDIYKQFLEILHNYQKEQKAVKEGMGTANKSLTETEVYKQVAKLFTDQPDLLVEFRAFLPDASGNSSLFGNESSLMTLCNSTQKKSSAFTSKPVTPSHPPVRAGHRRRLSSIGGNVAQPPIPTRRFKPDTTLAKDILAEVGKCGSLLDFAFFDKVRKSLGDTMYIDFLKCLQLFTIPDMRMTPSELMQMIQPYTLKMPELKKRVKDMIKQKDEGTDLPPVLHTRERLPGEFSGEIDYASCKRFDHSYLAIPRDYVPLKCNGRTALCHEVLNDTYVSFPSWSEDSSSVIKKTAAEEGMFRCEEDRYQMEIILENFNSTSNVLKAVQAKMDRMSQQDAEKYTLDNCLGGDSEYLHRKTIQSLYGEKDRATALHVIEGLKQKPIVVVPVVLHRLKLKIDEYRDSQSRNVKVWNEQNQKYYLKSLDHMGINFKQTDTKQLRSKALLQEIEALYEQEHEHMMGEKGSQERDKPLMTLLYAGGQKFMEDSASLIIHHVKRQTNIHQDEKQKIKQILRRFLPDLFYMPRGEMSDEEKDMEVDCKRLSTIDRMHLDCSSSGVLGKSTSPYSDKDAKPTKASAFSSSVRDDNAEYSLFYGNQNWYIFLRLHSILCERLFQFYNHAQKIIQDSLIEKQSSVVSTAVSLGLRVPPAIEPANCYSHLLKMVKNYLDGHIETTAYEEQLRDMFTINAYVAFTMDKLIQNIVRQLQHMVTDEACVRLVELYNSEKPNHLSVCQAPLNSLEMVYQRKAEHVLAGDNCFKIVVQKDSCSLSIDMIMTDSSQSNCSDFDKWMEDISQYAKAEPAMDDDAKNKVQSDQVFMTRNIRMVKRMKRDLEENCPGYDVSSTRSDEIMVCDNGEVRFDVKSYKMQYPVNSECVMYHHSCEDKSIRIARGHAARMRRFERFDGFVNNCLKRHSVRVEDLIEKYPGLGNSTFKIIPQKPTG